MSEVDRLSNSGLYPALPIADKRPSRDGSGGPPRGDKQPPTNPRRRRATAPIPQPHVLPSLSSTSTPNMIMTIDTILGIAGAALGFSGWSAALFTMRAVRGWRARCLAVESSLAAVRRELELVASISMKTGPAAQAHRTGVLGRCRSRGSGRTSRCSAILRSGHRLRPPRRRCRQAHAAVRIEPRRSGSGDATARAQKDCLSRRFVGRRSAGGPQRQ